MSAAHVPGCGESRYSDLTGDFSRERFYRQVRIAEQNMDLK